MGIEIEPQPKSVPANQSVDMAEMGNEERENLINIHTN